MEREVITKDYFPVSIGCWHRWWRCRSRRRVWKNLESNNNRNYFYMMPLALYKGTWSSIQRYNMMHAFPIRIARLLALNAIFVFDLLHNDIQTERTCTLHIVRLCLAIEMYDSVHSTTDSWTLSSFCTTFHHVQFYYYYFYYIILYHYVYFLFAFVSQNSQTHTHI